MALFFDLYVTSRFESEVIPLSIGSFSARRLEPLSDGEDSVSRYEVEITDNDGVERFEVEHRYGDGAWELVRKCLNERAL